jgi:hypothetical protein
MTGRFTRFMLVVGIPAAVLFLAAATVAFSLQAARVTQNENRAIRQVLCFFEARTLANPALTAKQKASGVRLYDAALASIHERSC